MSENDKILFRQDSLPDDASSVIPRDLRWAVGADEDGGDSGPIGGSGGRVGSITFSTGSAPLYGGVPGGSDPSTPSNPIIPTPIIHKVSDMRVNQTQEGFTRIGVTLEVEALNDVEFDVVITKV